jgi:hypothetical protein
LRFQNEPDKQTFNIVGLARSGTGFDQIDPVKGGIEKVKGFHASGCEFRVAGYILPFSR